MRSLYDHPLKAMLDLGLCVTVNSDDPAYFGGYVADNIAALDEALGLTTGEIGQLAKNSFEASCITDAAKRSFFAEIDAFLARAECAI